MFVGKLQQDWDVHLQKCAFAYRSSKTGSTNFTPFFLLHGREPKVPEDVIYGAPSTMFESHANYATDLTDRLKTTYATLQAVYIVNFVVPKRIFTIPNINQVPSTLVTSSCYTDQHAK